METQTDTVEARAQQTMKLLADEFRDPETARCMYCPSGKRGLAQHLSSNIHFCAVRRADLFRLGFVFAGHEPTARKLDRLGIPFERLRVKSGRGGKRNPVYYRSDLFVKRSDLFRLRGGGQ